MTPIKPEDRPKMIGLSVAAGLVMLFAFMQVRSAMAPPASSTPAAAVAATPGDAKANEPVGSLPEAKGDFVPSAPIKVASMPIAPQVDPFREVLAKPGNGHGNGSSTSLMQGARLAPIQGNVPSLPQPTMAPIVTVRSYTPGEGGDKGNADDIQLKGVMTGSRPLAVFSRGDKDVIVRPGEQVGPDAVLISVSNVGAVVRAKRKRVELEIGQAVAISQEVPAGAVGPGPLLLNGLE